MADATIGVLKAVLAADTADFTRKMHDASADVKKLADSLQRDLEPRQRAVNLAVRDFLGGTEIRKAQEYAQAVEKIGGVSALTAKDQAKVNAALADALEHYQKLGLVAPANLQKLYDATKQAEQGTGLFHSQFAKLTAAFSAANLIDRAISGVIDLGKGAFEAAGHIVDLSQKTGLSIRAVQQYGFIAEQTGGTVDNFADAIFKLGINIETGGDRVEHAVAALGLSYEHIRSLKPEEQFDAIARALQAIQDPQERNRIGVDLMSRSYANIAAAIDEYTETLAKAPVASDAAVKATDAAADAISRAWSEAKAVAIDAIGGIILATEDMLKKTGAAVPQSQVTVEGFNPANPYALVAGQRTLDTQKGANFGRDIALSMGEASQAVISFSKRVEAARAEIAKLTDEQRKEIDAALKLGVSIEDASKAFKLSEDAQKLYGAVTKDVTKSVKGMSDETKRAAEIIIADNARLVASIRAFYAAVGTAADGIKQLTTNSKSLTLSYLDSFSEAEREQLRLNQMAGEGFDQVARMNAEARKEAEQTKDVQHDALDEIAKDFTRLATVADGALSEIVRGFGTALVAADQFRDSLDALNDDSRKGFLNTLEDITSVASAIIQLTKVAIQAGKALHDAFTRSEAEKAAADIRRQLGVNVSEDDPIAKQVESDVKRLGIDRGTAINLNLGDIIQQAGGINESNFARFRDRTIELMDAVRKGGEVGARAIAELDDVIGQLGEHVQQQGDIWDRDFVNILKRAQAEGMNLASVMALIDGQLTKAAGGLNKVAAAGADTQDEFDRMSRLALATFNAEIANGKSAAEAIKTISPAVDALEASLEKSGFAGNAAFEQLKRWSDLVDANAPLLDQVSGLNELMSALANVGALDAATFADIQAQGKAAFDELTAAGFSQIEAETQIAPLLENIIKLHEERGLAIDEETQKLIDQARADGVLKEQQISDTEILADIAVTLRELFGKEVPESLRKMAAGAKDSAQEIQEALGKIKAPVIKVPIDYDPAPFPDFPSGSSSSGGDIPNPEGFAGGSRGLRSFNPAGELVQLHGNEEVLTEAQSEGVARMVARALASGTSGGDRSVSITVQAIDSDNVRRWLRKAETIRELESLFADNPENARPRIVSALGV